MKEKLCTTCSSMMSPTAAERFVAADPYVKKGLVKSWRVREWTTVVGPGAEAPAKI
jgi:hypothetical protein